MNENVPNSYHQLCAVIVKLQSPSFLFVRYSTAPCIEVQFSAVKLTLPWSRVWLHTRYSQDVRPVYIGFPDRASLQFTPFAML